jgi:hypothetical protein
VREGWRRLLLLLRRCLPCNIALVERGRDRRRSWGWIER